MALPYSTYLRVRITLQYLFKASRVVEEGALVTAAARDEWLSCISTKTKQAANVQHAPPHGAIKFLPTLLIKLSALLLRKQIIIKAPKNVAQYRYPIDIYSYIQVSRA